MTMAVFMAAFNMADGLKKAYPANGTIKPATTITKKAGIPIKRSSICPLTISRSTAPSATPRNTMQNKKLTNSIRRNLNMFKKLSVKVNIISTGFSFPTRRQIKYFFFIHAVAYVTTTLNTAIISPYPFESENMAHKKYSAKKIILYLRIFFEIIPK